MAYRGEVERNKGEGNTYVDNSQHLTEIQQGAVELASFLNNSPINVIHIESVIPSAKLGLMASIILGRVVGRDPRGNSIVSVHKTSTACIQMLEMSMDTMTKKKKKEKKEVLRNIKIIRTVIQDESNWINLFNPKGNN